MTTTRRLRVLLAAGACLAAVLTAAEVRFEPREAGKYPAHQSQADVTIGVKPYHDDDLMALAFGRARPYQLGVLPILVVMTNGGEHAISLENLQVRYIDDRRNGIEPIPAEDLATWNPKGHQPTQRRIPGVGTGRPRVKKGPLAREEITQRAFNAPVLGPGQSVHGFFYYNVGKQSDPVAGAQIYLTGLRNLTTGQELFYFEIPLEPYR